MALFTMQIIEGLERAFYPHFRPLFTKFIHAKNTVSIFVGMNPLFAETRTA